jgi:hypothetical protein
MKRKLFIGSSSEGKYIAEKLKTKILEKCSDWIEPILWADKNVFILNTSTFNSLMQSARKFEYGIFVATADDVTTKRNETSKCMRDNVLFEAGMFLGSLGLTRAFLLADNECKLPSDYAGTTVSLYDNSNLDSKITEIIESIKTTRNTYKFNVVPSTALAIGYFDNYVKPLSEKHKTNFKFKILIPNNISDIQNQIDIRLKQTKSKIYRKFWKKQRPIVFQSSTKELWDIPTTLSVLNTVINTITSHNEIGINTEKEEWLQHEIRNFKGTLEFLISQNCKCKNSVLVKYLETVL